MSSLSSEKMGGKFWFNEEDKAMVESVLGTEACEFLKSSASNNLSFASDYYDLQAIGMNQIYGNPSNDCRSDDNETKLFSHLNQMVVGGYDAQARVFGLEQKDDYPSQADEWKPRKRGRKLANGIE